MDQSHIREAAIDRIMRQGTASVLANKLNVFSYADKVKYFYRGTVARMDSIGDMGTLHTMANRSTSWKVYGKH